MNISSESLVKAVQNVIHSFEANNSQRNFSLQELADLANSGYTTIRQIKNGSLKSLTVKKALEISSRLNGPIKLEDLLSSKDQDILEFEKRFSHLVDFNLVSQGEEEYFHDKNFAQIIWAAFSNDHISRDEIRYRWGQDGIERLEFLLLKGLLIEEEGIIKGNAENAGFGIKSSYKQLSLALPMYKFERSKTQKNWVSFQTNSVNDEFITEFRNDLSELFKKFHEKSNAYEYRGNKKMFFGMIFDKYLEQFESQSEKMQ